MANLNWRLICICLSFKIKFKNIMCMYLKIFYFDIHIYMSMHMTTSDSIWGIYEVGFWNVCCDSASSAPRSSVFLPFISVETCLCSQSTDGFLFLLFPTAKLPFISVWSVCLLLKIVRSLR